MGGTLTHQVRKGLDGGTLTQQAGEGLDRGLFLSYTAVQLISYVLN